MRPTDIHGGRAEYVVDSPHVERGETEDQHAAARTPYALLWSVGIAAAVICAAAFLLWGTNGVSTLFDMVVALCT